MKRVILFAAAAAMVLLTSCNKEKDAPVKVEQEGKVEVFFTVNGDAATRAVGNTYTNESKVNDLQILVFNEDGSIADYKDAGASMATALLTSSGKKTVWAVVNGKSLAGITSLDALLATTTDLADNETDSFLMSGSIEAELTDGATVGITVKRHVARVSIGKISAAFKSSLLVGKTLKIKGIYLINVAGDHNFGFTGDPTVWYNKLGHADTSVDHLVYDALAAEVSEAVPYEVEHAFYPYPNLVVEDEHTAPWTPRHTILDIEVELDGETGWYPIVLPQIERNKTYTIEEVVITRRPSSEPYIPVETGETTVSVNVSEWELGLNLGTITI